MEINKPRGIYIAFEGIGGCGKTTQEKVASDYLSFCGIPHIVTREPGGTPETEKIRALLFEFREGKVITPRDEFLLFSLSRSMSVRSSVEPSLLNGKWVLSDRCFISSAAYQGAGGGLDTKNILNISRFATGGLDPDYIFFYDVTVKEGMNRRYGNFDGDPFDKENVLFWRRIANQYHHMSEENWGDIKWVKINGLGSINQVSRRTIRELDGVIKKSIE